MTQSTGTARLVRLLLFGGMTLIWGTNFFFTAIALSSFSPSLLVLLRMTMGALVLGLAVLVGKRSLPRTPALWWHLVVLGLIGIAVPYTVAAWALLWVDTSTGVALSSTSPIFVFLIATTVMRTESFSTLRLLGVITAFAGIVLLMADEASSSSDWFWSAIMVGTSVTFAIASVYAQQFLVVVDPLVIAFLQLAFASLLLLPVVMLDPTIWIDPTPLGVIALVELGVLATAIAYVIFFYFIRTWGSTATSLNTYLQPVVGVFFGVSLLGERLTPRSWLALAIIVGGVAVFGWATIRQVNAMSRS